MDANLKAKIERSIKHYSTLDGIFACISQGFSENFMIPYALALKATAAEVGLIASLPSLVGSLSQLKTAWAVDRLKSRMALISPCVLLHALMWVPMIMVPYLGLAHPVLWFLVLYTAYIALNAFDMPAWSSLMADHVDEKERGSFFGWRNRFLGFISVAAFFVAGPSLDFIGQKAIAGFTMIFTAAFISRLISWAFLRKMYDIPLTHKEEHRFTFAQFIKRIRVSNFGRFVTFAALMNFGVSIFSPFITVYLLRDLKFDYTSYTVVMLVSTVVTLASQRLWGVHADRVGNRKVLRLTSCFLPFVPFLWIFSHNMVYLFLVQAFAGFFWSGFNLCTSNFMFDAVTPEKRTRCIAYFNVLNGVGIFFGAILGGFMVQHLPPLFGYKILTLALISAVVRAFAAAFVGSVREVRAVKTVSSLDLFYSVTGLRPLGRENEE